MENKRGQFFALYLVLLTLLMCALVGFIYNIQNRNIQNSLVSPVEVMELGDNVSVFGMRERALIRLAADDVNWESPDKIRDKFFDLLSSSDEGRKMREFIFKDFVSAGWDKAGWAEVLKSASSQINFLESRGIYEFSLNNDVLSVNRRQLEKELRLDAKDRTKINFVVDVNYVYEASYDIKRGGVI